MENQRALWGAIFDFIKTDGDLAQWLSEDEEEVFLNNDPGVFDIWKTALMYQGFDPLHILKLMRVRSTAYMAAQQPATQTIELTVGGAPKNFTYSSHESMARDCVFLCFLFSMRGSTWEKFQTKSIPAIQEITGWLEAKYDLETEPQAAGTSLPPDVVTIPRIAACLPLKMCELQDLNIGKKLCTFEQVGLGNVPGLTGGILSGYFPCMLPIELCVGDAIPHIFTFLVNVCIDNVLHKKTRSFTDLDDLFQYYAAAFRTPAVPAPSRKRYSLKAGYLNATGDGWNPNIVPNIGAAEARLRGLRPDDASLEIVIRDLRQLTY